MKGYQHPDEWSGGAWITTKSGKSAVVNVWVDPNEYAPGTKAQTMYK